MKAIAALLALALVAALGGAGYYYTRAGALDSELTSCTQTSNRQQSQLQGLERVTAQLREANLERTQLRTKLAELEGVDIDADQLAALREKAARVEELAVELEAAKTLEADLSAGNAQDADEALQTLQAEVADKQATIEDLQAELVTTRSQTDEQANALQTLQDEVADKQATIDELQAELAATRTEVAEKRETVDDLQAEYDTLVADLRDEVQAKTVELQQREACVQIDLANRVLFPSGSATLTEQGEEILNKVAETLKTFTDKQFYVVGHTDSAPIGESLKDRYPSNWELSAYRSAAVVRHLVTMAGVSPSQLAVVGRASVRPLVPNDTWDGRAKNRRVEIIVSAPLDI